MHAFLLLMLATVADGPFEDRAILPQPFDREPFHAVRIPGWVEETMGAGYTLSGMDTDARKKAVEHGVTISEMGFVDPFYAYYDSALLKRRSPHVPLDRIDRDIAEYDKLGLRILGVYPPSLQGEVYELHPEWRRIATDTREIPQVDLKQHPYGGMLCLLGPYGDFFIDVLAEIVTKFPQVDAFSFDGLHYGGVCYCASCRENYRRDTGEEIPKASLEEPAFRRYQHWADRKIEDLIVRMQRRLKGINPEIALVTWTTNAGRYGHYLSLPRNMPTRMNLLLDAPDQEFWLDETNRGPTIVPAVSSAYAWAVTNHRVAFSEPYLMSHGNPYGKDSFPGHEVLRRMLLTVTYGARPSIAVGQPGPLQHATFQAMDEVQHRKPWLTHLRPERWAGLVMSDNTRTFYGRDPGRVEDRYLSHVFGAFRACVEEHLPVTLLNDWNLTPDDLSGYRVLILPNTACLDDCQVAAIDRFVRDGGGLVASLDTSRFDEYGEIRDDFALASLLGVSFRGVPSTAGKPGEIDVNFAKAIGPDYWEKRKGAFETRFLDEPLKGDAALTQLIGDGPVTFRGPALAVEAGEGAKAIATIRPVGSPESADLPAIVVREVGKGRVAYLAAGLDAACYAYAYPYQREVLGRLVRWAAGGEPPVRVEAPMCVHVTLTRQQKDGARLVVQLFNDVNTTAFHALPTEDVPLREETIPITGIRVTFGPEYRPTRIHLEPMGHELATEPAPGGGVSVVVPRLEVHAMVVAELAAP